MSTVTISKDKKYFIGKDLICLYFNGKEKLIHSYDILYKIVKDIILNENLNTLEMYLENPKEYIKKAIERKSSLFGIKDRLKKLENSNLSSEPLIKFIERLSPKMFNEIPELISSIGTLDLPITWEGNLIGYQRASFMPFHKRTNQFIPGEELKASQTVGNFTWVLNKCPDTGNVFEVLVKPENITDFNEDSLTVNSVTHLNKLNELINKKDKSIAEILIIHESLDSDNQKSYSYSPATSNELVKYLSHLENNPN